jgi:hypothetical protein
MSVTEAELAAGVDGGSLAVALAVHGYYDASDPSQPMAALYVSLVSPANSPAG